jgi:serine/threonine protein kinase
MNDITIDFDEHNSNSLPFNYKDLLIKFGIKYYFQSGFYLKTGIQDQSEGWIFHVSVRLNDLTKLAENLIPYLIEHNLPFLIPLNADIHSMIINCELGYTNLGKVIVIFPNGTNNVSTISEDLIKISGNLRGPAVPTDIRLGNIIYAKYGSYENTESKFIINNKGTKIPDLENVPFKLYPWQTIPFKSYQQVPFLKNREILNGKYLIREVIKPDAKGFVMKALYQKNIFKYQLCIIKEGKMNMAEDEYGRTIEDRLIWQRELHKKLYGLAKIPCLLDFFKENANTYLVLEYVKGISMGQFLNNTFEGNHWDYIDLKPKLLIIDLVSKAIILVQKLHQNNIIHRDLNINNFIINKDNEVYLIDLELAYDSFSKSPLPPFEKGTFGYMSPEQQLVAIPTFEQDIYSLGAVIIKCFIQFDPSMFEQSDLIKLSDKLHSFCSDTILVDFILECLNGDFEKRPSIDQIKNNLVEFKNRTVNNSNVKKKNNLDYNKLKTVITESISSLYSTRMTNTEQIWLTSNTVADNYVGNQRLDYHIEIGLKYGVSGIFYLLSKAQLLGFNIGDESETLNKNWGFIQDYLNNNEGLIQPGFYAGKSGIAAGIYSLIKAGLITKSEKNIQLLFDCFSIIPSTINIENGMAGYGLSLLKCSGLLTANFLDQKINNCIDNIIKRQLPNGVWSIKTEHSIGDTTSMGFHDGISGIIWFLLNYNETNSNTLIQNKIIMGLDYMIKESESYKGYKVWTISSRKGDIHDFYNGGFNLLLPFIKAYSISNEIKYKNIVEQILFSYPKYITTESLSQENGLSGLGEIYLEAWQAFKNEEWLNRAEWIASLLMNTTYGNYPHCYWIQQNSEVPSAGLFNGSSGIIHFLLRIFSKNELPHYLSKS